MDRKLQELTDKIYREGVEKGEEKGREIVGSAEDRAAEIIRAAEAKAESIVCDAKNEAEGLKRSIEAEIRLLGNRSLRSFKQQIVNVITLKTVDEKLSPVMGDPENLKELIKTVIQNWKTDSPAPPSLEFILPENARKELDAALNSDIRHLLSEGISVAFSNGINGGFKVGPKGGSYKVSLTDEDFIEYFKSHLKPKTRELLFGGL